MKTRRRRYSDALVWGGRWINDIPMREAEIIRSAAKGEPIAMTATKMGYTVERVRQLGEMGISRLTAAAEDTPEFHYWNERFREVG